MRKGPSECIDIVGERRVTIAFDDANATASVVGADGEPLTAIVLYWFAWYAFHPDTAVYTADDMRF